VVSSPLGNLWNVRSNPAMALDGRLKKVGRASFYKFALPIFEKQCLEFIDVHFTLKHTLHT
jgi:hypothetical protein